MIRRTQRAGTLQDCSCAGSPLCARCRGAGRIATNGQGYFMVQHFTDGSCAVKTTVFSHWQAITGPTGNRHVLAPSLAADFARDQNRLTREAAGEAGAEGAAP